jgi:hypothetical protein
VSARVKCAGESALILRVVQAKPNVGELFTLSYDFPCTTSTPQSPPCPRILPATNPQVHVIVCLLARRLPDHIQEHPTATQHLEAPGPLTAYLLESPPLAVSPIWRTIRKWRRLVKVRRQPYRLLTAIVHADVGC